MIYLVTGSLNLFTSNLYKIISAEESIKMMNDWNIIQFDTETKGVDAHISPVLCAQFGNKKADT